ncbi:MAG: hypothetical protein R2838_13405 [Caldilineaceae bacterium]
MHVPGRTRHLRAPIGCYNLVAVAVSDYTDAIPRLDNITPSVIREEEVGGSGTGPAVQRTFQDLRTTGKLDGKQVIIVSTAESEMIGSDLSSQLAQIAPGSAFYYSNSLAEDEWAAAIGRCCGYGRISDGTPRPAWPSRRARSTSSAPPTAASTAPPTCTRCAVSSRAPAGGSIWWSLLRPRWPTCPSWPGPR